MFSASTAESVEVQYIHMSVSCLDRKATQVISILLNSECVAQKAANCQAVDDPPFFTSLSFLWLL